MKDIKAILSEHELDSSVSESIIKAVNENYRTIDEMEKKAKRIDDLTAQNKALTEQVGELQGDGEEVEKLRKQVADFQEAENQRKATEAENEKREAFRVTFDAAVGERKFANDLVRSSVFESVYKTCSEDAGAGAKDTLEALTKDMPGVWENPQTSPHNMPNGGDLSQGKQESVDTARKTIRDFMAGIG